MRVGLVHKFGDNAYQLSSKPQLALQLQGCH